MSRHTYGSRLKDFNRIYMLYHLCYAFFPVSYNSVSVYSVTCQKTLLVDVKILDDALMIFRGSLM